MSHQRIASRFISCVILLAWGILSTGCTDNVEKMSIALERTVRPLADLEDGATVTVPYRPETRPDARYTLVFFPDRRVTPGDLVEAGLPMPLVDRLYRELAYLDIGSHETLVAIEPGEAFHFTTAFRTVATVDDLLVLEGQGTRNLLLEKRGDRWVIKGWS